MKEQKKWKLPIVILAVCIVAVVGATVTMVVLGQKEIGKSAGKTFSSSQPKETEENKVEEISLKNFTSKEEKTEPESAESRADIEKAMKDKDGYIFPHSDRKELTEKDLKGMSAKQLTYARNEIYARHGFDFKSKELQEYFDSKSWYHNKHKSYDCEKGSIEEKNVSLIIKYQKNDLQYTPK